MNKKVLKVKGKYRKSCNQLIAFQRQDKGHHLFSFVLPYQMKQIHDNIQTHAGTELYPLHVTIHQVYPLRELIFQF